MIKQLLDQVQNFLAGLSDFNRIALILLLIAVIALLLHWLLHRVFKVILQKMTRKSRTLWQQLIFENKFFRHLAFTLQGLLVWLQLDWWLDDKLNLKQVLQSMSSLWVIIFITLTIFSILDGLEYLIRQNQKTKKLPVKGLMQSLKLFISIIALIFIVSLLLNRSPLLIVSGLGAMTAVIMLIFKDPILGLIAGIQLSANDMLRIGDWLEMSGHNADGEVLEIGLTTVKVKNWDKTVTTIPTHALISQSFKNWRGMSESGGRRIKRAVYIDVTSVSFLSAQDLEQLKQTNLLQPYLQQKQADIAAHNQAEKINPNSKINGRRLTNLGTFRAYLLNYLKNHPQIHQNMTVMVRQLATQNNGIPLEIYAFTKTTVWGEYEQIQADIFDHIFAVTDEFKIKIHQNPSSHDLLLLNR